MGAAIKRVGFVGIGNMGWPMAANLLKAGFELVACDAVPGRSAQFAEQVGGRAVADAAEAAQGAEDATFRARMANGRASLLNPDGTLTALLQSGRGFGVIARNLLD